MSVQARQSRPRTDFIYHFDESASAIRASEVLPAIDDTRDNLT
jgi:hypothetical protein